MSTTYNFAELDSVTHNYLIAVRASGGRGTPGIFISKTDPLPAWGLIVGPLLILSVLVTLIPSVGIIIDDPIGVGMLQTAGFLVGFWLLAAGFRTRKDNKVAGSWVYVDPLFLYQAFREQVTITPIDEIVNTTVTSNYNNGAYQNSVISIRLAGHQLINVTVANEVRAEQMLGYLNYLAWARGPEGGERARLDPARLGGLARYVAKTGNEPLDAQSHINLGLLELDFAEVPEEQTREGRATPSILPYFVWFIFTIGCFALMAFVIDPALRDDAVFARCTEPPLEPRVLRGYLTDQRLTQHRDEIIRKLSTFYDPAILHVRQHAKNPELRDGMIKILESLRTADQPVASVEVMESGLPDGQAKTRRQDWVRDAFVKGINDVFGKIQPAIVPPPDTQFKDPPPPIGHQLIAFVQKDPDMPAAHFEIHYTFVPTAEGKYRIRMNVTLRTEIDKPPVASEEFPITDEYSEEDITIGGVGLTNVKDTLIDALVGRQ